METNPASKLIAHWREQGLYIASGCPDSEIRLLELQRGLTLPPDVLEYFRAVDGMAPTWRDSVDKDGFAFLPMAETMPARQFAEAKHWDRPQLSGDDLFLVFVDYLQSSWVYAVRCAPSLGSRVVLIGRERPEIIAESFEEYVELYTGASPRVYEGTPVDVP